MIKRFITIMALIVSMLPIFAISGFAAGEPTIKVESVTAEAGASVSVPIVLSDNTGICGATIKISYDENLVLTAVEKGNALPSLTMTKPGNLTANPITIPWDGLEADATSGTLVTLTFTAPEKAGTYSVNVSFDDGDIVDGDLKPVDVKVEQGGITVAGEKTYSAENIGVFYADEGYEGDSMQATAFIATLNDINGEISFTVTPESGEPYTYKGVTTLTAANVVFGVVVSGLADANAVGEITIE